jgi:hypothetical protein
MKLDRSTHSTLLLLQLILSDRYLTHTPGLSNDGDYHFLDYSIVPPLYGTLEQFNVV